MFPYWLPLFTTSILIYLFRKKTAGALRRAQDVDIRLAHLLSGNGERRGSPSILHTAYGFSSTLE